MQDARANNFRMMPTSESRINHNTNGTCTHVKAPLVRKTFELGPLWKHKFKVLIEF